MRFIVLVGFAFAAAASVEAQNLSATYGKALLQCYAAESDKLACLGRTAEACMAREEDGETTVGAVSCMSAETEIWDSKLNEEYKITRAFFADMDSNDDGQRVDALTKAQRTWIAFRDGECALEYSVWDSGSARSLAGADCVMNLTAERTTRIVELRELME